MPVRRQTVTVANQLLAFRTSYNYNTLTSHIIGLLHTGPLLAGCQKNPYLQVHQTPDRETKMECLGETIHPIIPLTTRAAQLSMQLRFWTLRPSPDCPCVIYADIQFPGPDSHARKNMGVSLCVALFRQLSLILPSMVTSVFGCWVMTMIPLGVIIHQQWPLMITCHSLSGSFRIFILKDSTLQQYL